MFRFIAVRNSIPQGICVARTFSSQSSTTKKPEERPAINPNVEGLSEKCVKIPNHPVGPGAAKDKDYKNPEYFCYTATSFAEAEVEMEKYRLPAPSNKVKFVQNG